MTNKYFTAIPFEDLSNYPFREYSPVFDKEFQRKHLPWLSLIDARKGLHKQSQEIIIKTLMTGNVA